MNRLSHLIPRKSYVHCKRTARLAFDSLESRVVPATANLVTVDSIYGNGALELKSPGNLFDQVEALHAPYVLAEIPDMPYGMVKYDLQGVPAGSIAVVDNVQVPKK